MSISTEDLTKDYGGTKALDGVSISVDQGDILGVVGDSGSANFLLTRVDNHDDPDVVKLNEFLHSG
jgi:D-methionine transport system ATP-binding protein